MVKQSKVKYEYVKGKGMNKNKNTRNRAEERSVKRDTSQTCKLVHVLHQSRKPEGKSYLVAGEVHGAGWYKRQNTKW